VSVTARASLSLLVLLGSCRFTEMALVTVRNETTVELSVHVRLPGDEAFREDLLLESGQESSLLKYEEPGGQARPVLEVIEALKLVTATCALTLEGPALAQATLRVPYHRRWLLRVTPVLLRQAGCP
jgi:hypothetical protein